MHGPGKVQVLLPLKEKPQLLFNAVEPQKLVIAVKTKPRMLMGTATSTPTRLREVQTSQQQRIQLRHHQAPIPMDKYLPVRVAGNTGSIQTEKRFI